MISEIFSEGESGPETMFVVLFVSRTLPGIFLDICSISWANLGINDLWNTFWVKSKQSMFSGVHFLLFRHTFLGSIPEAFSFYGQRPVPPAPDHCTLD